MNKVVKDNLETSYVFGSMKFGSVPPAENNDKATVTRLHVI